MELVLPMYNAHTYFSVKNLGKKYILYTAKYGTLFYLTSFNQHSIYRKYPCYMYQ